MFAVSQGEAFWHSGCKHYKHIHHLSVHYCCHYQYQPPAQGVRVGSWYCFAASGHTFNALLGTPITLMEQRTTAGYCVAGKPAFYRNIRPFKKNLRSQILISSP